MKTAFFTALALFCLPAALSADWEKDLRQELKLAGFSSKEIEAAIDEERRERSGQKATPDFVLPPDRVKRDVPEMGDLEAVIRKRLLGVGYEGAELDRKVQYYLRMPESKRESRLNDLEQDAELEAWLSEMLDQAKKELDDKGWDGSELKERLSDEEGYFKDVKPLFDEAKENAEEGEEPKVDKEELAEQRESFEQGLAEVYIKEVEKKTRSEYSDAVIEGLLEVYQDYVGLPFEKRKAAIVKLARSIRAEILEQREKEFRDAGKIILQDLKTVWAEIALPPNERKGRRGLVTLICDDLSVCETEAKFMKILEKRLRDLRKEGVHKDEISIIEKELVGMAP